MLKRRHLENLGKLLQLLIGCKIGGGIRFAKQTTLNAAIPMTLGIYTLHML